VDVVISNCVINLTQDKGQVFDEVFRILRPGGRMEVSDMVTDKLLDGGMREDPANWGSCVFGALPEQEYRDLAAQAGFRQIEARRSASAGKIDDVTVYSIHLSARK
jgi:ubiquinone/menaquinone biosynthesis C-methylase UbiE